MIYCIFQTEKISKKGQAALSLVFLIGGIIILIGVTVAFLTLSFLNTGFGLQSADRARAVATAGAYDALMQLTRESTFASPTAYAVPVGGYSANVTVVQNSPVSHQATILSKANVLFHERDVQVIVTIAPVTGQINVYSWKDITL